MAFNQHVILSAAKNLARDGRWVAASSAAWGCLAALYVKRDIQLKLV